MKPRLPNLLKKYIHTICPFPGIGPISAAVIYAEYGDISNFSNPGQMLAFAGIEPGINDSGTESHGGRMVKHGSSQLRYVLLNACLPLIRFDITKGSTYDTHSHSISTKNLIKISLENTFPDSIKPEIKKKRPDYSDL